MRPAASGSREHSPRGRGEPDGPENRPLARGLAVAGGFAALSLFLGFIRFSIPGVEGGISDLREIGALLSVFHLPHWGFTIVVSVLTSLQTPPDGSIASTTLMHVPSLVVVWLAWRRLSERLVGLVAAVAAWVGLVAIYYYLLVLPIMVATNLHLGLLPETSFLRGYLSIGRTVVWEFVSTALVVALYAGVDRELRRRKRAEAALRRSEAQLQGIFRAAPVALGTIENGGLSWFNGQLEEMTGIGKSALAGLDPSQLFVDPGEYARLARPLPAGESAGEVKTREVRWRHAVRGERSVLLGLVPLDEENGPGSVIFAAVDVTDSRHLEQQLQQAQRLEALGRLTGEIAHDFRNYLNVISGFADILRDRVDGPKQSGPVDQIRRAAAGASELCRQLLTFGRMQPGEPTALSTNERIESSLELIRRLAGVRVELELAPDTPAIRVDPGQFDQVLMNLVANARDAVRGHPDPTRDHFVEIRTAPVRRAPPPGAKTDDDAPRLWTCVAVRDTGLGMDSTTRERIFEPFFTTKPEGEGTGLGLATVHGIVTKHGGFLEVRSEPGAGAAFETYWPTLSPGAAGPALVG